MEEKKIDSEVHEISAEEVNEIMAKYDRESAVRVFAGNKALIIKIMLIAFTVFAVSRKQWQGIFSVRRITVFIKSRLSIVIISVRASVNA